MTLLALALAVMTPAWADTPGIAGTLEQSSATSPKEKVDFAASAVDEIGAAIKAVEKLLAEAEKDKDTEAVECLQRKLTPMKALHEVSKTSSNGMQQFLAASDVVHADLEYRKIAVALSKTRDFLAEAQACVGETGAQKADAIVSVEAPEDSGPSVVDVVIDVDGGTTPN